MDYHQFNEEENESVGELSTVSSQIVLKCLYLARNGRPDILWSVNKLARAVTKWTKSCDKRLARLISYIHHTILLFGKHSTTKQTWIAWRLWFRRRPWRLRINTRRGLVFFRKSHVCANKLEVQETDFSFTQFYRSWNHLSRCRFTHGRYSSSHSLGFGDWSISFRTEQNRWTQERATARPVGSCQAKHAKTPSKSSTPTSFQQTLITFHQIQRILVLVLCLWGQWGGNQNDYQRSHNETCLADPD